MSEKLSQLMSLQLHPDLGILRIAALAASQGRELDEETQGLMLLQVSAGVLRDLSPTAAWQELLSGLMAETPSRMLSALHNCGALAEVLPEVAALFGVQQIASDPQQVDIGCHLLRVLDETARCHAPLPVRFAALVINVGKSDSPPEHLPVHYRHIERGHPRIEQICARFGVPQDCRELALLALAECERVHRVTEVRAGPVAAMLQRLGAFADTARFEQLLLLCACDYRAYPGLDGKEYPKAELLHVALQACADIDEAEFSGDSLQEAHALAIAAAFRSERWSESQP
ncbi:MAG: tRNA nucleotidyltransferase [Sideroxydans sp.]|nr:tRNA nucleotidyltransferase [Sideroxydans sp.]